MSLATSFVTTVVAAAAAILLASPAHAADVGPSSPTQPGADRPKLFETGGDYVHISNTPPRAASAHGYWFRRESDASEADVSIQLQILRGGAWVNVGRPDAKRLQPREISRRQAHARVDCVNDAPHSWRSVIDVDLVGYLDSADKLITPARTLDCGA